MIETILTALQNSTPALRQRYLDRIRSVGTAEARAIEQRLYLSWRHQLRGVDGTRRGEWPW